MIPVGSSTKAPSSASEYRDPHHPPFWLVPAQSTGDYTVRGNVVIHPTATIGKGCVLCVRMYVGMQYMQCMQFIYVCMYGYAGIKPMPSTPREAYAAWGGVRVGACCCSTLLLSAIEPHSPTAKPQAAKALAHTAPPRPTRGILR